MRASRLFLCGLVLNGSLVLGIPVQAQTRSSPLKPSPILSPREAYKSLVRAYEKPAEPNIIPQPQGTKLIFLVPGALKSGKDERQSRRIDLDLECRIVKDTGEIYSFALDNFGSQGGPSRPLPALQIQRLDQLTAHLPKDSGRLPPPGRELILLVGQGDHYLVRVYDRGQLPQTALEIARVCEAGKLAISQGIGITSQWATHQGFDDVAFGAFPNGQQVVTRTINDKLKVWDPQSHALIQELPDPNPGFGASFSFSPDGSLAVLAASNEATVVKTQSWQKVFHYAEPEVNGKWGQFAFPQFTADGRYLLLQSLTPDRYSAQGYESLPQLRIYDIKTGASVATLPDMPLGARTYAPAPHGGRAVYLSAEGSLKLWDSKRKRDVAILEPDSRISRVSFSPDNSQVAVVTVEKDAVFQSIWKAFRIRVWNANNGKLISELSPSETRRCDGVAQVLWSPDGCHLLGAVCPNDSGPTWEVAVWNVRTGRQRGAIYTAGQVIEGMALLPDGQLLVASRDNIIRAYDSKQALENIRLFEKSLPRL